MIRKCSFYQFLMKRRESKQLHKNRKRQAQMLSFGKFAHRLVQTASYYTGARISRISEAYTTKTCGRCGLFIHRDVIKRVRVWSV